MFVCFVNEMWFDIFKNILISVLVPSMIRLPLVKYYIIAYILKKIRSDNFERTFWYPGFSQKTNKGIHRISKNEFICSLSHYGRNWGDQKSFRNYLNFETFNLDLVVQPIFGSNKLKFVIKKRKGDESLR